MSRANLLYDRAHLDYNKTIGAKTLYVDGVLPPTIFNSDYRGTLQIHNAVGKCQAVVDEVIEGVLPENYSIYADNDTSQVVLVWPGAKPISNALINPSLETGDLTGWTPTPVGGTGDLVVNTAHPHTGSNSAYWAGGKGLGSEAGIECYVENSTKGLVNPGQKVTASVWILYNTEGGTPKGSRGQCQLNWYNANDEKIGTSLGYLVKTRKFNGKWTNSIVSDKGPLGTAYVKLVAWVTATGAGHTYFDDAEWDVPDATGATVEGDITLRIKVTDEAGRVAYWEGTIPVVEFILPTLGQIWGPAANSGNPGVAEIDSDGKLYYLPAPGGSGAISVGATVQTSLYDNKLNKSNGDSFVMGTPVFWYRSGGFLQYSNQTDGNPHGFDPNDLFISLSNGNGGGPFPMKNGVFAFPPWLDHNTGNGWLYASGWNYLNICLMTDTNIYYFNGRSNSDNNVLRSWSKSNTGTSDIFPNATYTPPETPVGGKTPIWFITKDKKIYYMRSGNGNFHLNELDEGLNPVWVSPWVMNTNGVGAIAVDGGYLFVLVTSAIRVYKISTGELMMSKPISLSVNASNIRTKMMVANDRIYIQNGTNLYAVEYVKGAV